jgi:hypothetical protein
MTTKLVYCGFVAFMFLLSAASTSLAHEVKITGAARLGNGPFIEEGTYRIEVIKNQDSSDAVFYHNDNEVVRTPVRLVSEASKARQTEVWSEGRDDGRVITQIRLQGSKEALVFEPVEEEFEQEITPWN